MIKKFLFLIFFIFITFMGIKSVSAQVGDNCETTQEKSCGLWEIDFYNPNPGTSWEVIWRHEWYVSGFATVQATTLKSNVVGSGQHFYPAPISTDHLGGAPINNRRVHWATACADPIARDQGAEEIISGIVRYPFEINLDPVLVPNGGGTWHYGNGDNLGPVPWPGSVPGNPWRANDISRCYPRYSCNTNGNGACVQSNCNPGDNNCYTGSNADRCGEPTAADRCEGPISGQVFLPNGNPLNGAEVDRNGGTNQTTRNIGGVNGSFRWTGLNMFSDHTIRLIRSSYDQCAYDIADNTRVAQVIDNNVNFRLSNVLYNIGLRAIWDAEGNGRDAGDPDYSRDRITFTTNPGGRDCSTNDGTCIIPGNPTDPGGRDYDITLSGVQAGDIVTSDNPITRNIVCNGVNGAFVISKAYQISGKIFNDINFNRRHNPLLGENLYTRSNTVSLQGLGSRAGVTKTQTVNDGTYQFGGLLQGQYRITFENPDATYDPDGYRFSTPTNTPKSYTVTVAPGASCNDGGAPESFCDTNAPWVGSVRDLNFGITPIYSLSGGVFIDDNGDGKRNPGNPKEAYLTGQGIGVVENDGSNSVPNTTLLPDNDVPTAPGFSFSYLLQRGFKVIFDWQYNIYQFYDAVGPTATPPGRDPTYTLNLDRPTTDCTDMIVNAYKGTADCTSFGITNLNFALEEITQKSWMMTEGGDIRFDEGYTNRMPNGKNFSDPIGGNNRTQGIVFGTQDYDIELGQGEFNPADRYVTDSGLDASSTKMFYNNLNSIIAESGNANKIVTVNCGSGCNIGSFQVPNQTAIYRITGSPAILSGSFAIPDGKNYIFLAPGDLTINTNITVPKGSTAVFAAGRDLTVSGTVVDLQGIFSAAGNLTFATKSNPPASLQPPDEPITVQGSLIIGGNLRQGSLGFTRAMTPRESRDGIGGVGGPTPTLNIIFRPDFIINLPALIRTARSNRVELAPGR